MYTSVQKAIHFQLCTYRAVHLYAFVQKEITRPDLYIEVQKASSAMSRSCVQNAVLKF